MSYPSVHSEVPLPLVVKNNCAKPRIIFYINCYRLLVRSPQSDIVTNNRPSRGRRPAEPCSKCKLNCEREYKIFIRKIEICFYIKINILDLAFVLSPKVYSLQLFADPKTLFVKIFDGLPNQQGRHILPERLLYLIRVGFCVELSFQHFSILFLIG